MDRVIIFLVGVLIGTIIYGWAVRHAQIGTLRIDQSDPGDQPYLFLELHKPIHTFAFKSNVFLKVKREDFISHE